VSIVTGWLTWVSTPRPGAGSDITAVREDRLCDLLRIPPKDGRPETWHGWIGDLGFTGITNMRKPGDMPNVKVPLHNSLIRNEADREHNRLLQSKRVIVEM
jgi:hypothetical protein